MRTSNPQSTGLGCGKIEQSQRHGTFQTLFVKVDGMRQLFAISIEAASSLKSLSEAINRRLKCSDTTKERYSTFIWQGCLLNDQNINRLQAGQTVTLTSKSRLPGGSVRPIDGQSEPSEIEFQHKPSDESVGKLLNSDQKPIAQASEFPDNNSQVTQDGPALDQLRQKVKERLYVEDDEDQRLLIGFFNGYEDDFDEDDMENWETFISQLTAKDVDKLMKLNLEDGYDEDDLIDKLSFYRHLPPEMQEQAFPDAD